MSDKGSEFRNAQVEAVLNEEHIRHTYPNPYNPNKVSWVTPKAIMCVEKCQTLKFLNTSALLELKFVNCLVVAGWSVSTGLCDS